MEEKKATAVLEAVLFTMGNSVELEKLAGVIEASKEETAEILHQMAEQYEGQDRGIKLIELDGSYQLCTKSEFYEDLIKIAKMPKKYILTDVQLETLSIIAYKQPVTKLEIENIRGVSSGHTVNKLIEYNLVCEVGRLDAPGRPMLFGTTEEFLRSFGVQSLEELPSLNNDRVEEFKRQAEEEVTNLGFAPGSGETEGTESISGFAPGSGETEESESISEREEEPDAVSAF